MCSILRSQYPELLLEYSLYHLEIVLNSDNLHFHIFVEILFIQLNKNRFNQIIHKTLGMILNSNENTGFKIDSKATGHQDHKWKKI